LNLIERNTWTMDIKPVCQNIQCSILVPALAEELQITNSYV